MIRSIASVFISAVIVLGLTSCIPKVALQPGQQTHLSQRAGQEPGVGIRTSAGIGTVMFTEFDYTETSTTRLIDGVNDRFGFGAQVFVPPGAELVGAQVSGQQAYCTVAAVYREPLTSYPTRSVCFFDKNEDGRLDEYWVTGTFEATSREIPPAQFTRLQSPSGAGGGFKKELIYQGVEGSTLKISYREFVDDLAQPAFQQDLTFEIDSAAPTLLVFQNARLEVYSADDREIQYKVLQRS